jgi:hypothetical protein
MGPPAPLRPVQRQGEEGGLSSFAGGRGGDAAVREAQCNETSSRPDSGPTRHRRWPPPRSCGPSACPGRRRCCRWTSWWAPAGGRCTSAAWGPAGSFFTSRRPERPGPLALGIAPAPSVAVARAPAPPDSRARRGRPPLPAARVRLAAPRPPPPSRWRAWTAGGRPRRTPLPAQARQWRTAVSWQSRSWMAAHHPTSSPLARPAALGAHISAHAAHPHPMAWARQSAIPPPAAHSVPHVTCPPPQPERPACRAWRRARRAPRPSPRSASGRREVWGERGKSEQGLKVGRTLMSRVTCASSSAWTVAMPRSWPRRAPHSASFSVHARCSSARRWFKATASVFASAASCRAAAAASAARTEAASARCLAVVMAARSPASSFRRPTSRTVVASARALRKGERGEE